jgi:hypothetical protein
MSIPAAMTVTLDVEGEERRIIGDVTSLRISFGYLYLEHDHPGEAKNVKVDTIERLEVVPVVRTDRGAL